MFGLAERAWNISPTYTPAKFNKVVDRELTDSPTIGSFHVRQPGIIVEDGMIKMNSPYTYGNGTNNRIFYTPDACDPTTSSAEYTTPVAVGDATEIRAKLYMGNTASVTTILYVK